MIRGLHAMFYTSEPEATRAFLRDTLGFRAADAGHGWLICEVPTAEVGCHPPVEEKRVPAGRHSISFFCDDVTATVAELEAKSVRFTRPISDAGFGLVTCFEMPGGVVVELYQPKYELHFE